MTGSTAVGFANSNMQMHSYVYDGSAGKTPPYNLWNSMTVPGAGAPVNITALGQLLYGHVNIDDPSSSTPLVGGASTGFVMYPFIPRFLS